MLTLRHFEQEDAETLRSFLYPDMTIPDIQDMIRQWNTFVHADRYFEIFAVLSEKRMVGTVSLYEHSRNMVSAGAEIFRDEQGKGYGAQAMILLEKVTKEKGYRLILNQVRTDNGASLRLHEKLGYERDSSIYCNQRGHEVYLYIKLI
ncbi:MAG: GNAT family N-acetyltransferase [Lachnospiraceae bacterium]|nr:GNAT family N-acetyltransferase [Lachnospiraceae bacterium]